MWGRGCAKSFKRLVTVMNEYSFHALSKDNRRRKKMIHGLTFDRPYVFADKMPVITDGRCLGICLGVELGFGTIDRKPYAIADIFFFANVGEEDISRKLLYAESYRPYLTNEYAEVDALYFA